MRLCASFALVAASVALWSAPSLAAGDLLVAPTRVVLDGARGTEVILNNIDSEPATYRISLELRRMLADGSLEDVAPETANAVEAQALAMISYAPRRVVLAPNQPQAIRIGVRAGADLPDGEYRAHMLFRAIPTAKPVTAPVDTGNGVSIALTPIYGVTIPIIFRKGGLKVTAAIGDVRIIQEDGHPALSLSLTRAGNRSTYGRIRVLKQGKADPVFEARGLAVYPEINRRAVSVPIDATIAAALAGPATIQYVEEPEAGGKIIAEVQTVIG
jgi:P pilus assembly chaperone PapD